MTINITYYAIMDELATAELPAGIARRSILADGGTLDEALHRDLIWRRTPLIVSWRRGESTDDLVEVPAEEAQRIIERFRERWPKLPGGQ